MIFVIKLSLKCNILLNIFSIFIKIGNFTCRMTPQVMTPQVMLDLLNLILPDLVGQRNTMIPEHLQLLITIKFLASGSYQRDIDIAQNMEHPVSQTTVSRCIDIVLEAICGLRDRFIPMPQTAEERQRMALRYL